MKVKVLSTFSYQATAFLTVGVPMAAVVIAQRGYLFLDRSKLSIDRICALSWPPEANCVVEFMPYGLGVLLLLLGSNLASFLLEAPSETEVKNVQTQYERRHAMIEEMVEELEDHDWDSDELGMVVFGKLRSALIDLLELPRIERNTLEKGFHFAWLLFEKELRVAIAKTKEGEEIEYANGKKLDKLLSAYDSFYRLALRGGAAQDAADVKRIWDLVKKGRRAHRTIEFRGVSKALQMLWMVRTGIIWVALEMLVSMVAAMVSALSVYYRSEVLDTIQLGGETFWVASKAMVFVELTSALLLLLAKTLKIRGGGMVAHEVKVKYFKALIEQDLSWWAVMGKEEEEPKWELFSLDREVKDFLEIPQDIAKSASTVATHSILVLTKSSRSFYFLLFLNFGMPILSWVLQKVTHKLRPILMRGLVLPSYDEYTWLYAVDAKYVSTFQSFGRSERECQSYAESSLANINYEKREFLIDAMEDPMRAIVSTSLDAAQIKTSGALVNRGKATLSQAQAMMKSSEEVAETTDRTWSLFKQVVERAQPLANVYDLCVLPKKIKMNGGIFPSHKAKGHIVFNNVSFKYPNRKVAVLKGLSFEALAGQTCGMTGQAGCGKSTVMKLLERFYDVDDGQILLDGVDIREYNPEWLRNQIVAVSQEATMIPTTLRENITLGKPNATVEEIYEACRIANIYDVITDKDRFPQGLRTEIECVSNISGGEKQRIAIARAVLANPPILLLDEATASLDEENQAQVQDALNKLLKGRTTLVIAHRLSTLRKADKIMTFDQGKIAESGTHDELVNQDGSIYGKLWNTQFGRSTFGSEEPICKPIPADDDTSTDDSTDLDCEITDEDSEL
ncbi:Y105 transport/processing ATP-binding protein MesD [Seminavis robusta]|uniref:Y105 transport/processing ATP-binding protein MesD n=1 Tax=Seminavis robusta TaxID=568900 RepID=A0A9N8EQH2_9STRA|nr:Y105 transport/processing ATP-binding protein MesD [Seminavis robusta]|eukprot:Sro1553_g281930.1 Y105 transport/processing ATP-binding protein MesD (850) ;mRNA; f:8921-11560